MNLPWESEPRVDENFLKQYDAFEEEGQPPLAVAIIERFLASVEDRFAQVSQAIESKDSAGLQYAAHAIKNISGNVGARRLTLLFLELEKRGEEKKWDDVNKILQIASNEIDAVRPILIKVAAAK